MAEQARTFGAGQLAGAVAAALAVGFFLGVTFMELRSPAAPAPAAPAAMQAQQGDGHDHAAEQKRIAELELALAQKPGDQAAWIELGNLYFDTHQAQKSIAAYEKAVALGPVSADVWTDLGIMHREAGQTRKALETFDTALKLDQNHENALYNKGVVLLHDAGDKAGAAAAWERLLKANPGARTPDGGLLKDRLASMRKG